MRLVFVGAGGVGGLYGGLMARAGHEVGFLARGRHLAAIRERGLEVRSAQFGTFTVEASASDRAADLGQPDVVVLAVKTYDLNEATEAARTLVGPHTSVLTLQNGVEAPDQVAAVVGREHVLIGTTSVETTIAEPGVVAQLSQFHRLVVSEFEGPPTGRVEELVAAFKDAGINVQVAPDGRRALWEKAIFLIPFAQMTAVCRSSIGPIRDVPETRTLAETVYQETLAVARACGVELGEAAASGWKNIDSAPPSMTASMARDFERGNRTELDWLGGAIVRLADQRGVAVPANKTIYAILKLREQQR